jgi:hypothetical protein
MGNPADIASTSHAMLACTRMHFGTLAAGLGVAVLGGTGCSSTSSTCQSIAVIPPVITVRSAATGQPICDATVVAVRSDGARTLDLVAFPPDGGSSGCPYGPPSLTADGSFYGIGTLPSDGSYTVQVSKPGFQSVSVQGVAVRSSAPCGGVPAAQRVDVLLKP